MALENIEQALHSVAQSIRGGFGNIVFETGIAGFIATLGTTAWQDTGIEIVLPKAGVWLLMINLRTRQNGNAGTYFRFKLVDENLSQDVAGSLRISGYSSTTHVIRNDVITVPYTTTEDNTVISVHVQLSHTTGINYSRIEDDTNGVSSLLAVRLY